MNLKALLIVASLALSAGLASCATETATPPMKPAVTAAPAVDATKDKAKDTKPADAMAKPDAAKDTKPTDAMAKPKATDTMGKPDAMAKPDATKKPQ